MTSTASEHDPQRLPASWRWHLRSYTWADLGYLLLIAIPLLVIASMFLYSALAWQINRNAIDVLLSRTFGAAAQAQQVSLGDWYDRRTSKQSTLSWREIESASTALSQLFDVATSNSQWQQFRRLPAPGEPWSLAETVEQRAKLARPVIHQMKSIAPTPKPVWHPPHFSGFYNNQPFGNRDYPLWTVLHVEILDAFYKGETDRAMEAIRLWDQVLGPGSKPSALSPVFFYTAGLELIRATLPHDVWSSEQLAELQQIVSRDHDWDAVWRDSVTVESRLIQPWLRDRERLAMFAGYPDNTRRHSPMVKAYVGRSSVAPSEALAIVARLTRIAETGSESGRPGSRAHADAVSSQVRTPYSWNTRDIDFRADHWLKVPYMRGSAVLSYPGSSQASVASDLAGAAIDQRFTAAAIAIKRFEQTRGHYPNSLSEIGAFGLSQSTTRDASQQFRFEVNQMNQSATLWKNHGEPAVGPDGTPLSYNPGRVEFGPSVKR